MGRRQMDVIRFFAVQTRKLSGLLRTNLRQSSARNVHDLRVTIRRVRAILTLLKESSKHARKSRLERELRSINQALGKIRDIDVGIANARHYGIDATPMKSRRQILEKRLKSRLAPSKQKRTNALLANFHTQIKERGKQSNGLNTSKGTRKLRRQLKNRGTKRLSEDRQLHELRILFKKTRYTLEALGQSIHPLRKVQNNLGRLHDLSVLQDLAGKNKALKQDMKKYREKALHSINPARRFALSRLHKEIR